MVGEIKGFAFLKSIKESKHLLFSFGGVPALDAVSFDANKDKIAEIKIKTDKGRTFSCSKETFDLYKKEIDYGYGRQYVLPLDKWEVAEKSKEPIKVIQLSMV